MNDDRSTANTGSAPKRRDADFPEHYIAEDEINLYELWNALARRWYVFVGVFFAVVLAVLAYALSQEATYQYRSSIEIGTLAGVDTLAESPYETRNRLRESIIPFVRAELAGEMENVPRMDVTGGEDSSLLVVSTEGSVDRQEDIERVHRRVAEQLRQAHSRILDSRLARLQLQREGLEDELEYITDERTIAPRRQNLQQSIESAEAEIASLREQREGSRESLEAQLRERERRLEALAEEREIAEAELERLDQRAEILERRIKATEELLADLRRSRTQLMSETGGDPTLALFLGTTELDQVQSRLDSLEDQYNFGLVRQRDELRTDLKENHRSRGRIEDELTELRIELENLDTRYGRRIASERRTISKQETALARLEANLRRERRNKEREIREVEAQIDNVTPTQAGFVSVRSVEQTGIDRTLTMALAIALGGMLGLFSAFFREFVSNARRYRQADGTAQDGS